LFGRDAERKGEKMNNITYEDVCLYEIGFIKDKKTGELKRVKK
jgi:hypothetical protein